MTLGDPYVQGPKTPPKKKSKALVIAVVVVAAFILSCGIGAIVLDANAQNKPAPTVILPTASRMQEALNRSAAPVAKTQTTNLKLGSVVKIPAQDGNPSANMVALQYKRVSSFGELLDAVQVRLCIGTDGDDQPSTVSADHWSLLYDNGESSYDEKTTGGQQPEYPWLEPRIIQPGKCAKGWINYTDAPGSPEGIQYQIQDKVISWKFK